MSEQSSHRLSSTEVRPISDGSPFISWLGLRVVALDHDRQEIRVAMPMRPELERRPGTRQFHGGSIAAFIDIAGDFAIGMLLGGGVPTMNFRPAYLRPPVANPPPPLPPLPPARKTAPP